MINVFKKRTRLYALTTSAFFFLQGVDSSVGSSSWWPSGFVSGWSSVTSFFSSSSSQPTRDTEIPQRSGSSGEALPVAQPLTASDPAGPTDSGASGPTQSPREGGETGEREQGSQVGGNSKAEQLRESSVSIRTGDEPERVETASLSGNMGGAGVPGGVGVGGVPGGVGVGGVPGGVGGAGVPESTEDDEEIPDRKHPLKGL
ncbi:hypothetical protein [Bartonella sp. MM73XJBT.G]|uniref:hypothetical protein n=1 Tax=Bartonella sp. MM73XJBT.G TaxID=3019097 RepID=UPI002362DD78|nr:hypothetical protein [Bartonella sp. MM73XJBT.G]